MRQCYDFKSGSDQVIKAKDHVNVFFESQVVIMKKKRIAIHHGGLKEKIDQELIQRYRNQIDN